MNALYHFHSTWWINCLVVFVLLMAFTARWRYRYLRMMGWFALDLGLAAAAEEHTAEHEAGDIHCDVCDLWYDEEDPCPYH